MTNASIIAGKAMPIGRRIAWTRRLNGGSGESFGVPGNSADASKAAKMAIANTFD